MVVTGTARKVLTVACPVRNWNTMWARGMEFRPVEFLGSSKSRSVPPAHTHAKVAERYS